MRDRRGRSPRQTRRAPTAIAGHRSASVSERWGVERLAAAGTEVCRSCCGHNRAGAKDPSAHAWDDSRSVLADHGFRPPAQAAPRALALVRKCLPADLTRDEATLMPRYARRPQAGRASLGLSPARRADDGRHRDEREVALLAGQLRALGRDISRVRSSASTPTTGAAVLRRRHLDALRPRMRGECLSLPDGAEIRIRQIEPEDATELNAAFCRLTAVTRYGRFLGDLASRRAG